MGDLIQSLIEFVAGIWHTDSEMRDNSVLGESKADRRGRSAVARVCGGAIVLLVIVGLCCWWWIEKKE